MVASTHGHDIFVSLILVYKSNLMLLILLISVVGWLNELGNWITSGADLGFQVRGAHVKKLRRVEGGANIFGVFRVKNHDFTPKNHIFPMAEGGAKIVGVFRVKNRDFTPKNHIFFQF